MESRFRLAGFSLCFGAPRRRLKHPTILAEIVRYAQNFFGGSNAALPGAGHLPAVLRTASQAGAKDLGSWLVRSLFIMTRWH